MSTPHLPSPSCPSALTSATLRLHYLAEGAANIIYSASVVSPPELKHHCHCCILRLRKDLPSTKPAVEVMRDFEQRIAPLFAGHEDLLMKHALYPLTPEMVEGANAELREMEIVDPTQDDNEPAAACANRNPKKRPRDRQRRHIYLPAYETEQYGILMQNLEAPGIDQLVEFKPKWLVQSPSAPADAKSCRTCALNAMRRHAGQHQGRGDLGFCPLDLLSDPDVTQRLGSVLAKIYRPTENGMAEFVAAFRRRVQPALRHLVTLQQKFRSVGLQDFRDPAGKNLDVAMALRDCSVFLALRTTSNSSPDRDGAKVDLVDVKFADLDLKSPDGGKIQKWASMEQELLDGGWYYHAEETDCALSRYQRASS